MRSLISSISSQRFEKYIQHQDFDLPHILNLVSSFKPKSCFPYISGDSFRMVENWRSVVIQLSQEYVLVLKGTELLSADLIVAYKKIFQKTPVAGKASLAYHFLNKEHKVPLVFSFKEASQEYEVSKKILEDYFKVFGVIPQIPIPIALYKYSDKIWEQNKKYCSLIARECGLELHNVECAIFAYLYKGHPSRLKHWKFYGEMKSVSRRKWLNASKKYFILEETLAKYISLFVRLSSIGWLLAPMGQEHIGYCIKDQNMTLDGGFVDFGNAYKITPEKSDFEVETNFINSLIYFCESVSKLILPSERISSEFSMFLTSHYVLKQIYNEWLKLKHKTKLFYVFKKYFESDFNNFSNSLNGLISEDAVESFDIVL